MPTVLRLDGFTVIIFLPPREHGPAHVHVRKGGGEVVIEIDPVRVVRSQMPTASARAARRLVETHRDYLLSEWEKIHG